MNAVPAGFDSIFRYIIVVSQRAEQLIRGAKPRLESPHSKPTLVAMDEVEAGLVTWRVLTIEEIEAQRQAMVEQIRAEMGGEVVQTEEAERPLPDVLPTAGAAAVAEIVEVAEEEGDRDEEVLRLQELLGIGGDEPAPEEASDNEPAGDDEAAEPADLDVTDEG